MFSSARSNRQLWFCLVMRLISSNKVRLLACAVVIAFVTALRVLIFVISLSFAFSVAVKPSGGKARAFAELLV